MVIGLVGAMAAPPVSAQAAPAAHEEAQVPEAVDPSNPCEVEPPPERPADEVVAEWPVDSEGNPLPPPERPADEVVAEWPVDSEGNPLPPPERPADEVVAEWPVDSEGNPLPPPERPADEVVAEGCLRSYRMNGGASELVINAVVCDISQPFTVTGSNITIDFTPKASDPLKGGTYSYFGDFGKFTLSGNGTYKLTLKKRGGTLVGQGRGKATTPRGTFSNNGKEHYKLTPATC
jgi:hypothetical protein